MDIQRISFADIKSISDNISEIIVDDGVEIDDAMVDECHGLLAKIHNSDFGLLVNTLNSYAYTFSAQRRIGVLEGLRSIAFVVYKRSTEISTMPLISIHSNRDCKISMFHNYDEALSSLMADLAAASSN